MDDEELELNLDLDIDIDLEEEEESYNRKNIIINVLLIIQIITALIAFIITCWLISNDQGGPAIGVFFFLLIVMGISLFMLAAKLYLKWFIINEF